MASEYTLELFKLVDKRIYKPEDVEKIKSLLEAGADANYQDADDPEETTFARVLDSWKDEIRLEVVELLIQHGADVNMEFDTKTPLIMAARRNHFQLVNYLLEHGAKAGIDNALKAAIEKDNFEMVKLFIAQEVDVNCFQPYNESFIDFCNETYRLRDRDKVYETTPGIKIAKLLIENGADVNGIEGARVNPIQTAIAHDFVELTELLLKNGAKPITQNDAFPILSQVSSVEMAKLFMAYGADLNDIRDEEKSRSALQNSIQNKNKKLIKFFIDAGADLYATDEDYYTAFHYALYSEDLKFLEFLLEFYDLNKCNQIKPLLEVADEQVVKDFIKEKMGFKTASETIAIETLQTEEGKKIFDELLNEIETNRNKLKLAEPELLDQLPDYKTFLKSGIFENINNKLLKNLELWEKYNDKPLQALYFEFGGAVSDPFDAYALFYGFASCDDSLKFKDELFDSSGDISLSMFFQGIDELLEDYDEYYTEVKTVFSYTAYLILNLAFGTFVNSPKFLDLNVKAPFYVLGAEHDEEPVLLYKQS